MHKPNELNSDSLGLSESIIMGVAGTAPAFSISATTGALIASVGILAVGTFLYCGIIMFGITLAFLHLNRTHTSAGASFTWVSTIFNPTLGFFVGWSLLVSSAVFMVSGTIPAATATLALVSPDRVTDPISVTLVAAGWLLLVSVIVIKGIKLASYMQVLLTVVELGILFILIIASFFYFSSHPAQTLTWHDLALTSFTPQSFAAGALTALFFFWGWDVTLNLSEETANGKDNPGRGAMWAMGIILLLFTSYTVVIQFAFTQAEIEAAGTNILFALAEKLFPAPYSYMAVIAVILSTVGTLETTILQFTRTLYAKSRSKALHPRYGQLHKKWKTPWFATLLIVGIGLLLLFLSSFLPTVTEIITISVQAIGFQVAFYYGLTGFACAWHFRKSACKSVGNFITMMVWPLAGAFFMVFIAVYSVQTFNVITTIIGIGGILIGVIPLLISKRHFND